MQTSLYGFEINYVSRNGHFMVFSNADVLEREKLSEFQIKMLLSNAIPRLLELQVEELDGNLKLFYNITGKRKLSYLLRAGSMTIQQMFELLYGIADVLSASGNYMLQENRYVLLEEYIYCGEHLTDLYLTYVPRETNMENNTVAADLLQLLSRLVHKVSELQGSGYQELTSCLMEDSFNLPTLKALLRKHISQLGGGGSIASPVKPAYNVQGQAFPFEGIAPRSSLSSMASNEPSEPSELSLPQFLKGKGKPGTRQVASPERIAEGFKEELKPEPPPFFNTYSLQDSDKAGEDSVERVEGSATGALSKIKLSSIVAGAASMCLVWRLYLDHPTEAWLMICAGLTLLLGDLLYVLWFIWKPWSKAPSTGGPSVPAMDLSAYLPKQRAGAFGEPHTDAAEQTKQQEPVHDRLQSRLESMNPMSPTVASDKYDEKNSYYEQLDHRTVLLGQREATVLLNTSDRHQPSAPYLEYMSQEGVRKVEMTKEALVIGRSGEAADFEHKEMGVSRLHTEIVRDAGGFLVKDLGSRNGTYLNGQLLVPYQTYSLQEGDIVKLAATEFTFKIGS